MLTENRGTQQKKQSIGERNKNKMKIVAFHEIPMGSYWWMEDINRFKTKYHTYVQMPRNECDKGPHSSFQTKLMKRKRNQRHK